MEIETIYMDGDGETVFYASGHHDPEKFIEALQENPEYRERFYDLGEKPEIELFEIEHQHWRLVLVPQCAFHNDRCWFQSEPGRGAKKVTVFEVDDIGLGFIGDWK